MFSKSGKTHLTKKLIKPCDMHRYFFTLIITMFFVFHTAVSGQVYERTDTLIIPETHTVPLIDGSVDDEAWDIGDWQPIDQIWMPYDNDPANLNQSDGLEIWDGPDDFTGRFKVVWSSETNLLYFLVEVIDDVFVDGYVYNQNPGQGGGYPNYDIVEVFIDEDRSGGLHVFDGTGNVGEQWGTNAQNAFAYHLAADAPEEGETQYEFHALDIAGTSWSNYNIADYASHFPEFAMKRNGNTYTWEFSLIVHDDTYDPADEHASVVTLEAGKIMGLSMAYCDNDDPDDLRRDHFFGSVYVPVEAHNDHWMQADWFGVAKLVETVPTGILDEIQNKGSVRNYISTGILYNEINSDYNGKVRIRVFNILGREMFHETIYKNSYSVMNRLSVSGYPQGIYIIEVVQGNSRNVEKIGIY